MTGTLDAAVMEHPASDGVVKQVWSKVQVDWSHFDARLAGILPLPPTLLPVHVLPVGVAMHELSVFTLFVRVVHVESSHLEATVAGRLPLPPILLPVHELPVGELIQEFNVVMLVVRVVHVASSHLPEIQMKTKLRIV